MVMEKKNFAAMTNEELLAEKKKLKQSKIYLALGIGFLAGILIFGTVSWFLSKEKKVGFIIPMLIPIYMIYQFTKKSPDNNDLENALKARGL